MADANILNAAVGLTPTLSPAEKLIQDYDARIQAIQVEKLSTTQRISQLQQEIMQLESDRQGCKRKLIGWDNGCLNDNSREQDSRKALVTQLQQKLTQLDADLAEAMKQRDTSVTAFQNAQTAQAQANPEFQKAAAQVAAAASVQKQKLYVAAGVVIVVIVVVFGMVLLLKKS